MKNFILLIISFCCFTSCGPSAEEKAAMEEKTKGVKTTNLVRLKYYVNKDGILITGETDCCYKGEYSVYELDGCEYIKFNDSSHSWGAHSGTCPNPIHKSNETESESSAIVF